MTKIHANDEIIILTDYTRTKSFRVQIFSIILTTIIILVIVAALLIYFLGFHNKNNLAKPKPECPNPYSGISCDECGVTYFNQNTKIVGGTQAVPYSWPWTVYIIFNYVNYLRLNNSWVYINRKIPCTGVLINRRTVLTAARCIIRNVQHTFRNVTYNIPVAPNNYISSIPEMYKVYIGAHNISTAGSWYIQAPMLEINVQEVIENEDYDNVTFANDIAILKLTFSVKLNNVTQIACLPDPDVDQYPTKFNIDAWIAGWGSTIFGGPTSTVLNNAKLTLYDDTYCRSKLGANFSDFGAQMCAGGTSVDGCQGDSGAGLLIRDKVDGVDKFVLAGLYSYSIGCGNGNPGVYTEIADHLDWIYEHSQY